MSFDDDVSWQDFNAYMREASKERRWANHDRALQFLKDKDVEFKQLSTTHFRIGSYDYWPTTGLFIHIKTGKRGRGLKNIMRRINEQRQPSV